MIIELVRLIVTVATTAAGFVVGRALPTWLPGSGIDADAAVTLGAVVGAGVGYVAGGLMGRGIRRTLDRAPVIVERATGPQLFAGTFGMLAGVIVGGVIALPAVVLLPVFIGWTVGALLVLVLGSFGARVFAARAHDLLAAAGLKARDPLRISAAKGEGGYLIDSSAAIDGRVIELARSGLVTGTLWVAEFVIDELQGVADSGNKHHRVRGRRGLDVLDALRDVAGIEVRITAETVLVHESVDGKLLALAAEMGLTLVTTDHNLVKAAEIRGILVLNPHALGESMRPPVMSGDTIAVLVERVGTEPGQGVGFLPDGTMVVVEGGGSRVGDTVDVEIANSLRTSVGRMLFARMGA